MFSLLAVLLHQTDQEMENVLFDPLGRYSSFVPKLLSSFVENSL